jgi:hypothetical protein
LIGTVPMPHSIFERSIPFEESACRLENRIKDNLIKNVEA